MWWVAVTVVLATVAGLGWRSRGGRIRQHRRAGALPAELLAELDVTLGSAATLVQFSSAFCQPCRATRRVCAQVAATVAGVVHVEIDAESHLDAVRTLGILRTPTVLVLDRAGVEVRRAAGQPRTADVVAAVGLAVDAGGR